MANGLKMAEVYTIYALLERGWSQRRVARTLQVDRETVRRYARLARQAAEPSEARLAARLAMPTSPDTLLRRIRETALAPQGAPRVLGVDDWAVRPGMRYATILCDLEQHRAVDLLVERSATSLAEWLGLSAP